MKVIRIASTIESNEIARSAEYGLHLVAVSPTPLSALTSMRVSKAVDKHDADMVEVDCQKDAIAAISAKKLSNKKNFKVVYRVHPNLPAPRHMHKEVLAGVDGWIFPNERVRGTYPSEINKELILQPVSFEGISERSDKIKADKVTLLWIGDIKNTEHLKAVLQLVDTLPYPFNIRICGAGKARDVMPAVKFSRALQNKDRIVWQGEEYDALREIEECFAAVRSDEDLTQLETLVLRSGRPVLQIHEIESYLQKPYTIEPPKSLQVGEYITALRNFYLSL